MKWLIALLIPACTLAQSLATVKVLSKPVDRIVALTAEILPYQSTAVVARVAGYIENIAVDVGSVVRKGQLIARLSAPELSARIAEAQARALSITAQAAEVQARIAAAQSTASRLKTASQTPGAISANEIVLAEESVRASQASLNSIQLSRSAADAQVKALKDLESYLTVPLHSMALSPNAFSTPAASPAPRLDPLCE